MGKDLDTDVLELSKGFGTGSGIKSRVLLGAVGMVALVGALGGWAATSELSGAVIGQGQVKVDKDLRAVQHLDGGIIRTIAVKKGDSVVEGQVLFTLDDAQLRSELQIVRGQLLELGAKRLRLMGERDGMKELPQVSGADPFGIQKSEELANEQRLFAGNLQNRTSQIEQLQLTSAQINEEIAGLKAQQESNDSELKLVQAEFTKVEGLRRQGLADASRIFAHARDLTRLKGEHGQIEANIARSQARKNEIQVQILAIESTARTDAQKQLAEIDPRISELSERMTAVLARLSRLEIRSPVAGIVNEVAVNTIGGVITPAQKLLTIVPIDAKLQIETKIQPTDIDQLYVGQAAKLRFSAFSSRNTPELLGEVGFVSPATSTDAATGHVYYLAQVDVSAAELAKLEGKKLVPGMPVETFVQTESRTALSYLTKPLIDQFRRAFREQ